MNTPTDKPTPRPGGRSARVQAAVHQAVRELLAEMPREQVGFPQVAARAGVTPSTLYRRWGDIGQLLADVALERFRPAAAPADTGSLQGDLQAWAEQYIEEMGSPLGRTLMRDMLTASEDDQIPCACVDIIREQLGTILARAAARGGQALPTLDALMDDLVAPVVFRILYSQQSEPGYGRQRVAELLGRHPA